MFMMILVRKKKHDLKWIQIIFNAKSYVALLRRETAKKVPPLVVRPLKEREGGPDH